MALSKKDRCFIFDICFNQDDAFDAQIIGEYIFEHYGLSFPVDDIQSVIDELAADGFFDEQRCDKTVDMFGSLNANFAEQFA